MEPHRTGTFYDIHMHAFNLSHPSISSFLKRFLIEYGVRIAMASIALLVVLYVVFSSFIATMALAGLLLLAMLLLLHHALSPSKVSHWIFDLAIALLKRPLNLLALMENDLGNYLLHTEQVLKTKTDAIMINDKGMLVVDGKEFSRMVITPLMMDFGLCERISKKLPYGSEPIHKPIVDQVVDLFNGMRVYYEKSRLRLFEIYPFLGLNTRNYEASELAHLLDKYFKDYRHSRQELCENLGMFDGNIDNLKEHYFAGIKLYPPLGFDPWPDDDEQKERVKRLYDYCQGKQIPITVHCNDGGFVVDDLFTSQDRTNPRKWEQVLIKYGDLRLNLAHMGRQDGISRIRGLGEESWTDLVFRLITNYPNVYTDFSCLGFSDRYYRSLRKLIDLKTRELKKNPYRPMDKILFGSDFMINLLSTDSYNDYLQVLSRTTYFTPEEKERFYQINPERFLFG